MSPMEAFALDVIDPYEEVLAYEYLYSSANSTLKKISEATVDAGLLPTEALRGQIVLDDDYEKVRNLVDSKIGTFSAAIDNTPQYPKTLHVANERVPLIYYRGDINLIERPGVSIVGARKATEAGRARAARMARVLAEQGVVVVSGLATGIDTAAMESAIAAGGRVIGVIGTPIDEAYPAQNRDLQEKVAMEHLLVSQVPFYKYSVQPFKSKAAYFRERNVTMAAISDATVIVEASDTSGSLVQAKACIAQGRPLFIMKSCVDNKEVTWPKRFVDAGAIVLEEPSQVLDAIEGAKR